MTNTTREVFEALLAEMKKDAEAARNEYYGKIKARVAALAGITYNEFRDTVKPPRQNGYPVPMNAEQREAFNMIAPENGRCSYSWNTIVIVRPDIDEYIKKLVAEDMRAMFEGFIQKQTKKTDGILKGRSVEVTGRVTGNLECYLTFKLEDGARFQMQTQIVWKVSVNNNLFWQFPTTFHEAFTAAGEKIKAPSEAKLKANL